jgi:hypothetical protein
VRVRITSYQNQATRDRFTFILHNIMLSKILTWRQWKISSCKRHGPLELYFKSNFYSERKILSWQQREICIESETPDVRNFGSTHFIRYKLQRWRRCVSLKLSVVCTISPEPVCHRSISPTLHHQLPNNCNDLAAKLPPLVSLLLHVCNADSRCCPPPFSAISKPWTLVTETSLLNVWFYCNN